MPLNKILLIDDDPGVREFLQLHFEDHGYQVDTAFDGEQGVEKFKAGSYDLVISDMMMPKMIGLEVLRQVKQIRPEQKIILMSGVSEESMVQKARALGCQFYIHKPVRLNEVEERVKECLQD